MDEDSADWFGEVDQCMAFFPAGRWKWCWEAGHWEIGGGETKQKGVGEIEAGVDI